MREENIFKVGDVVEGESLIGYEKFYRKLRRDILINRGNLSLVGLHRMGKTSLMKKLHEEATDYSRDIIPIFVNLQELVAYENRTPFESLLMYVAEEVKESLSWRRDLDQCKNFCLTFDKMARARGGMSFRTPFKDLFKEIKKLGMHVLLSLDEFDAAEKIFETNADYELFRSLADPAYAVGLVFISRRRLYMIEKKNENNSTFHSAFREMPLTGLDEDDVKLFFATLERNYEISLPREQIERIKYYAGRSPYIYSAFCHELVEKKIGGQETFDADEIYKRDITSTVTAYADVLYQRLQSDGHLAKLHGILFGPVIGVTQSDKDLLSFMGYLSDESDIGGHFQALSSYFTDFLHDKYFFDDSWKNIIDVEKLMKALVAEDFPALDEKQMTAAYEKVFGAEKKFNPSLYKNFISNNLKLFDRSSTLLEVLSLSDTFVVIQFRWDEFFKKYFARKTFGELREKFELCAKARNPLAHGHPEYLTKRQQEQVNVYCTEILELVRKCQRELESAAPEENPTSATASRDNVGKVGTLTEIIRHKNGGLKGEIFGAAGTVAKNLFRGRAEDYVGKNLRVEVIGVNPQGNGYLLRPKDN